MFTCVLRLCRLRLCSRLGYGFAVSEDKLDGSVGREFDTQESAAKQLDFNYSSLWIVDARQLVVEFAVANFCAHDVDLLLCRFGKTKGFDLTLLYLMLNKVWDFNRRELARIRKNTPFFAIFLVKPSSNA